jgi:hypothetical protein
VCKIQQNYTATKQKMAWGSGAFNSCNALLERVEKNDPKLIELVILPMKVFGAKDLDRLSHAIGKGHL